MCLLLNNTDKITKKFHILLSCMVILFLECCGWNCISSGYKTQHFPDDETMGCNATNYEEHSTFHKQTKENCGRSKDTEDGTRC